MPYKLHLHLHSLYLTPFHFAAVGVKYFIYFKYVYPTLLQANTLQDFLFPCGTLTEFER